MNTVVKGLLSATLGLIAFGLLLFVPAGTTHYWQGWVFIPCSTIAPHLHTKQRNIL